MDMKEKGYVNIDVVKVLPSPTGCAVCLGNDKKVFVIYVGPNEGAAILMTMEGVKKNRPLTHDLISNIFQGFNIKVEYTLINDFRENTYYARLMLREENSLGRNLLEIDARPSDCIAIAKQQKAPIYIKKEVFEKVEDIGHILKSKSEDDTDFDFFNEKGEI